MAENNPSSGGSAFRIWEQGTKNTESPRRTVFPWLKWLPAFFVLLVLFDAYYTITSGTVGVLVTFGKYSEQVAQPGLHLKIPFVQSVKVFDIKMHTVTYKGAGGQEGADETDVIVRPATAVLDNKNLPISIEMSVQFTPIPEKASQILAQYGESYFDKLINPLIRDVVRDVIGQYQAEQIADKRSEIGIQVRKSLQDRFQHLPFVLNEVALREIRLPDIVLKKIEEVQLAKQEEQRLTMVEQQARKEQEINTIRANTKLIEVTTEAKANAEKQRIAADAEAYRISKEAEATAEANRRIAASLTADLIHYRSVDRWNGQYPQTLLGGGDKGLILSLPGGAGKSP